MLYSKPIFTSGRECRKERDRHSRERERGEKSWDAFIVILH